MLLKGHSIFFILAVDVIIWYPLMKPFILYVFMYNPIVWRIGVNFYK